MESVVQIFNSKAMNLLFKNYIPLLVLLSSIFGLSACGIQRYYQPVNLSTPEIHDKSKAILDNLDRYAILRQHQQNYEITNIQIDSTLLSLNGTISAVAPGHDHYIQAHRKNYYPSTPEIENEMHIYTSDTTVYRACQHVEIPLSQIERIEILQYDSSRTKKVHAGTVAGGILAGGIIIGVAVFVVVYSASSF